MNSKVAILILAAGSSSRMGKIKQLLPWKDSTLLENAIKMARLSKAEEVIVILGANARLIKESVNANNVKFIENKEWHLGLGTSISCGAKYLLENSHDSDAALILLADQALIDTEYINEMIDIFSQGKIELIGTRYTNKIGVPALFNRSYFAELRKLEGDHGAKHFLNKLGDKVFGFDPSGKTYDVDTLEDYNKLLRIATDKT